MASAPLSSITVMSVVPTLIPLTVAVAPPPVTVAMDASPVSHSSVPV
jgi:hypothetical protein